MAKPVQLDHVFGWEPRPPHECPEPFEAVVACPCCRTVDLHLVWSRTAVPISKPKRIKMAVLMPAMTGRMAVFRCVDADPLDGLEPWEIDTKVIDGVEEEACIHVRRVCLACGMNWHQACGWTSTERRQVW